MRTGYVEKFIYRWTALRRCIIGFTHLAVVDEVAHPYLTSECSSQGSTFTLAQPLMQSLKQFPEVQFVMVFDQTGSTEAPDGRADSIPARLDP